LIVVGVLFIAGLLEATVLLLIQRRHRPREAFTRVSLFETPDHLAFLDEETIATLTSIDNGTHSRWRLISLAGGTARIESETAIEKVTASGVFSSEGGSLVNGDGIVRDARTLAVRGTIPEPPRSVFEFRYLDVRPPLAAIRVLTSASFDSHAAQSLEVRALASGELLGKLALPEVSLNSIDDRIWKVARAARLDSRGDRVHVVLGTQWIEWSFAKDRVESERAIPKLMSSGAGLSDSGELLLPVGATIVVCSPYGEAYDRRLDGDFCQSERRVLVREGPRVFGVRDITSGAIVTRVVRDPSRGSFKAAFSPSGERLAIIQNREGEEDSTLTLYDVR
jgi:hypothetical protein